MLHTEGFSTVLRLPYLHPGHHKWISRPFVPKRMEHTAGGVHYPEVFSRSHGRQISHNGTQPHPWVCWCAWPEIEKGGVWGYRAAGEAFQEIATAAGRVTLISEPSQQPGRHEGAGSWCRVNKESHSRCNDGGADLPRGGPSSKVLKPSQVGGGIRPPCTRGLTKLMMERLCHDPTSTQHYLWEDDLH